MSFVDRVVAASQSEYFYKVNATDSTGRRAFYYILVDRLKIKSFLSLQPDGHYDLADYGEIIASGYGEEPSVEAKRLLKKKYGFDF